MQMDTWDRLSLSVVAYDYISADESGKSIANLEGKSGKIISIGCCFPPKFANSGTLFGHGLGKCDRFRANPQFTVICN